MDRRTLTVTQPRVNEDLDLKNEDYRYGDGRILAHVLAVGDATSFGGEWWWHIRAICRILPTDPGLDRELHVRASALPTSRR